MQIPKCIKTDNSINVSFVIKYKKTAPDEKKPTVVFYRASFVNYGKELFVCENEMALLKYNGAVVGTKCVIPTGKTQNFTNAYLTLEFLSDEGKKMIVEYKLSQPNIVELYDVKSRGMSDYEKIEYSNFLKSENKSFVDETSNENTTDNYTGGTSIINVEKYVKALETEKYYLKNNGGKQYKASNGRRISSKNGIYFYIFDLELELYIADDSPVTVSANNVVASGNVFLCEHFQIIVQLAKDLGDRVGSARISVEPWKIISSIIERIKFATEVAKSPMVSMLMEKGPELATVKPIENILKGQESAVDFASENPITVIWGPPGTGKTHTMAEMAIKYMDAGKRVLIVSHSNVSVDGVAKKTGERLLAYGRKNDLESGCVLRYGYVRDEELKENEFINSYAFALSRNKTVKDQLDTARKGYEENKAKYGIGNEKTIRLWKEIGALNAILKSAEVDLLNKASILTTTISKVTVDKYFEGKQYDVVMFDEISMANIPQVICAASFAGSHFICVGDFMQLSPIAQSSAKKVLEEDIFSYLKIKVAGKMFYHPWLVMLDEQRRMHPKISRFPSSFVYKNLLKDHESTEHSRDRIVNANPFSGNAINLINLSGTYCAADKNSDNSRFNVLSALVSFSIALTAEKESESVSIITPYSAQSRLVRAMILDYNSNKVQTELRCATVHQFQGSESDVIVFDAVESFPKKKPGWLLSKDLEEVKRLINVAITRARGKLIVVGNTKFWEQNFEGTKHALYKLIEFISGKGNELNYKNRYVWEKLMSSLSHENGPKFFTSRDEYLDLLKRDINKSSHRIVVSLPDGKISEPDCNSIIKWINEADEKGVTILMKSNDCNGLDKNWRKYSKETENATFPLIVIDDRIIWYGTPVADYGFVDKNKKILSPYKIVCRMKGELTAELIKSLSGLEEIEKGQSKISLSSVSTSNQKAGGGPAEYISQKRFCKSCKKPLILSKGNSGKVILWCNSCKKVELLSPEEINNYIYINNVTCPKDGGEIKAGLGKNGLYIRCECGHFLSPLDI